MTPEAQRIAIAEACGWTACRTRTLFDDEDSRKEFPQLFLCGRHPSKAFEQTVPNYPADLNAMHEAERVLTEQQAEDYFQALNVMENPDGTQAGDFIYHATAAQRCEAFLRTLGLWKEAA